MILQENGKTWETGLGYIIVHWMTDIVTPGYCDILLFVTIFQFPFPNAFFYTVALSDFLTKVLVIVTIFHFSLKGQCFLFTLPVFESILLSKKKKKPP